MVANASEHKPTLEMIIKYAVAHVEKGDKATEKAEQHFKAAGIHIAQCKERYKRETNLTWPEFCREKFHLTARRADELIMIGDGRTTLEEVRAKKKKSMRKARSKSEPEPRGSQSDGFADDEDPDEAQEIIANHSQAAVREAAALLQADDDRGQRGGIRPRSRAERGDDLYDTPAPVILALLGKESFDGEVIWECANGHGAISRVLRARGYRVTASDLVDYGVEDARSGVDFLEETAAPAGATVVLTNPPFMDADEFVRKALKLVPRVVMLLPFDRICGQKRADIMAGGQLARVYPFIERVPGMHRDGWDGNTRMEFAWFVWERDHRGPTVLKHISWKAYAGDEAGTVDSESPDIPEAAE
jgi:hypothetical protein